jgi:hypothetical protein
MARNQAAILLLYNRRAQYLGLGQTNLSLTGLNSNILIESSILSIWSGNENVRNHNFRNLFQRATRVPQESCGFVKKLNLQKQKLRFTLERVPEVVLCYERL